MLNEKIAVFKAEIFDAGDSLEGIKEIAWQYRDNPVVVQLCRSIENIVNEGVSYAHSHENEISELESQIEEKNHKNALIEEKFDELKEEAQEFIDEIANELEELNSFKGVAKILDRLKLKNF